MSALTAAHRKLVVALAGAAGVAVSQGLIDGTAAKWVTTVLAFLTALGVYSAPNAETPPPS